MKLIRDVLLTGILFFVCAGQALAFDELNAILDSTHRSAEHNSRDQYRHPVQTLKFFDVQPNMKVVEIWPGGGWYTEILAPYLSQQGVLYAAHFNENSSAKFFRDSRKAFIEKMQGSPDQYGKVKLTTFNPPEYIDIAPAGSADRVLTFRNVHNWYMRGGGDERVAAAFNAFYRALKPGGILGVVEHRLAKENNITDQEFSGYMHEVYVIEMAKKAGFVLLAKSEINANPRDSSRHPKGVWTLPPSLRLGEKDRDRYLAIGESDRMTLKFQKPVAGK